MLRGDRRVSDRRGVAATATRVSLGPSPILCVSVHRDRCCSFAPDLFLAMADLCAGGPVASNAGASSSAGADAADDCGGAGSFLSGPLPKMRRKGDGEDLILRSCSLHPWVRLQVADDMAAPCMRIFHEKRVYVVAELSCESCRAHRDFYDFSRSARHRMIRRVQRGLTGCGSVRGVGRVVCRRCRVPGRDVPAKSRVIQLAARGALAGEVSISVRLRNVSGADTSWALSRSVAVPFGQDFGLREAERELFGSAFLAAVHMGFDEPGMEDGNSEDSSRVGCARSVSPSESSAARTFSDPSTSVSREC